MYDGKFRIFKTLIAVVVAFAVVVVTVAVVTVIRRCPPFDPMSSSRIYLSSQAIACLHFVYSVYLFLGGEEGPYGEKQIYPHFHTHI